MKSVITILAGLVVSAVCGPIVTGEDVVQHIAPTSNSCEGKLPECRTAKQAAPYLIMGMLQYKINHVNEIASVLALMAFESVDFKYKHNVYPGRPGQGTANMQMAKFNLDYAKQIDGVKDKVANIPSVDGLSPDKLNEILALVQPDEYNFGSGPWFLATQCPADVRDRMKKNADDGFRAHMSCVGVDVTEERLAYFQRAKEAFGLH